MKLSEFIVHLKELQVAVGGMDLEVAVRVRGTEDVYERVAAALVHVVPYGGQWKSLSEGNTEPIIGVW
jgi:hypothetical protein